MSLIDVYKNSNNTKQAEIYLSKEIFVVRFISGDKLVGEIEYVNRSFHYVRDAAENFILGIFKEQDIKKYSKLGIEVF